MNKTAKILFVCAVLWEIASVLWFKNPFRHDFGAVGWFCGGWPGRLSSDGMRAG